MSSHAGDVLKFSERFTGYRLPKVPQVGTLAITSKFSVGTRF